VTILGEEIETIRCKFKCQSVTKRTGWNKPTEFLYDAKFGAVTDGSEENNRFFAATPSGVLEVSSILPDAFVPGKEYYLDIRPAD
jgi:hypothetical protein